eukprot:SAG11_NODE_304_length_10999_cov_3.121376_3_plen_256_part_00
MASEISSTPCATALNRFMAILTVFSSDDVPTKENIDEAKEVQSRTPGPVAQRGSNLSVSRAVNSLACESLHRNGEAGPQGPQCLACQCLVDHAEQCSMGTGRRSNLGLVRFHCGHSRGRVPRRRQPSRCWANAVALDPVPVAAGRQFDSGQGESALPRVESVLDSTIVSCSSTLNSCPFPAAGRLHCQPAHPRRYLECNRAPDAGVGFGRSCGRLADYRRTFKWWAAAAFCDGTCAATCVHGTVLSTCAVRERHH